MVVAREDLALEAAFWAQLPGNFCVPAAQGADHQSQLRGSRAAAQFPDRAGEWQSLGRGAGAAEDQRALAVLLFAARLRSARGGRRRATRHRAHVHLRADRFGEDGVSRLLRGDAGEARCHPGDLRQGSRARDPGAGDGRAVSAAQVRAGDRLQSARTARGTAASGVPQGLAHGARLAQRAGAHRARGGGPGAGARGHAGAAGGVAAVVAAGGVSRFDRCRKGCTPGSVAGARRRKGEYAWVFDGAADPEQQGLGSMRWSSGSTSPSSWKWKRCARR